MIHSLIYPSFSQQLLSYLFEIPRDKVYVDFMKTGFLAMQLKWFCLSVSMDKLNMSASVKCKAWIFSAVKLDFV